VNANVKYWGIKGNLRSTNLKNRFNLVSIMWISIKEESLIKIKPKVKEVAVDHQEVQECK
jgi:hypothetical protein